MEKAFWAEKWRTGQIGFHKAEVHGRLIAHEHEFLGGGPWRVLVPLCGKSLDLPWLRERGHDVVGVEIVADAIDAFWAEHGLAPERKAVPGGFVTGIDRLTLFCGDFFALEGLGTFDRIWDRAALVAVDPSRRPEYASREKALLRPSGRILLDAFDYDGSRRQGPPWNVPETEVQSLYAPLPMTRIYRFNLRDEPRWPDGDLWEHTWLIGGA